MVFRSKRVFAILLCICLLVVVDCLSVVGQAQNKNVFVTVPESLQASLSERLKMLVEFHSGNEFAREYEMLSSLTINDMTKDEYVKLYHHWYVDEFPEELLLDFAPTGTVAHEEFNGWAIYGCAKFRKKGRFIYWQASVDAIREKGDWYFSYIGAIAPIDSKPESCVPLK